jgi:hypothetical protein
MPLDDDIVVYDSAENRTTDKYRAIFSNTLGREVLADILLMCHFGATLDPDNKTQIAEYNVGLMIAVKAGLIDQLKSLLGFSGPNKEV